MENKDKLLSINDWIESFLKFQDEDFALFKELFQKKDILDIKDILYTIKNRMQERKKFYSFYKHISLNDLSSSERLEIQKKLNYLLAREELINEIIEKILQFFTLLVTPSSQNQESIDYEKIEEKMLKIIELETKHIKH